MMKITHITKCAIKLRLGNWRMGCIVPCNIVGLLNRYLTICANDWFDDFNYIVCYGAVIVLGPFPQY